MMNVLRTPGLASPPHQGVRAHLLRRIGGAVRSAIAGGLSLAGALRRPAAPQAAPGHAEVRSAGARPAPGQPPRARRPRSVPGRMAAPGPAVPSSRHGGIASWLGRSRPSALPDRPLFFPGDDTPFTPENCPGLGPELCKILNTPLEDCDPHILRVVLAAFARTIADAMPPDPGAPDARELFASLWGRFSDILPDAGPDDMPDAALAGVPGSWMDDVPGAGPDDVPSLGPDDVPGAGQFPAPLAKTNASPGAPAELPANSAESPSPEPDHARPQAPHPPLPEQSAAGLAHRPAIATAAQTAPGAVPPAAPARHRRPPGMQRRAPLRPEGASARHHRLRRCVPSPSGGPPKALPPRHCVYAARASPV